DHAGFEAKEELRAHLSGLGHDVEDCGAFELEEGDDYPDYITPCARQVAEHGCAFGIVFGASGQGEAMAANRVQGVRCAVYYGAAKAPQTDAGGASLDLISSVRAHNDANMLSFGARFLTLDDMRETAEAFLAAKFSGEERHVRRLR